VYIFSLKANCPADKKATYQYAINQAYFSAWQQA